MLELARERSHAQAPILDANAAEAPAIRTPQSKGSAQAAGPGTVVLHPSGLTLTLRDGHPVAPRVTAARSLQLAAKRVLDILASLAVIVAFAPAFLAIAAAIRISSPGPILFRQLREGKDGKPISIYKFRTMYVDRCDISGVAQTQTDDPRVTRIGRFLRRRSIDELPQLINVLKGEMSLIGPRPHAFGMLAAGVPYDGLVPYYAARQRMRPGLSGWAQANGYRGPTEDADKAHARIDHDLAYIENFSLALDLKIIFRTLRHELLKGTGV